MLAPPLQGSALLVPLCNLFAPLHPPQMYRFEGRLTPDADTKALLRSFLEGGYMGSASQEVPPPPSPLDWLVRGAQAKLAVVQRALETKVRGCRGEETAPPCACRTICQDVYPVDTTCQLGVGEGGHVFRHPVLPLVPCGATLRRTCRRLHRRCCPCC